ncbi:nitrate- and nitrite sensing domain-containing protein [Streptomyces sp. OS603R]|uniref:nitrate- and nitrite sensing domain-containing protein n=1 Tax=Streptomyces sp. OS603R TaxID=3035287 RepID=UPI002435389B|nr:nitrate- and nitrite sensing domain-containing protein [Streptomyces sp. OS603R]
MQKTRPRRKDKQAALAGDAQQTPTVGKGRPTHVRNRLVVAVAVVAAAIAGAGAPSVLAASQQLHDSQELVTLAERTQDALTLAHSLADERDEVVPYIAAGRPKSKAPSEEHSARVDRQVEELRADEDTSQALRDELDAVAAVRRAALTGKSGPLEAHQAYSDAVSQLHKLAARLADATPPRAGSGAHALTELDTAVQQAAATRGLLLAALNVPSSTETVIDPITGLPVIADGASEEDEERRDALSAAALQARVRSDAALADFRDAAPKAARASYDTTVTGPEVDTADQYLGKLTDKPTLSDGETKTSPKKLAAALTARIDMMRGVEASLFEQRTKDLAQLRDEDVTELEIRIAVLGALLLLAVGVATAMARTLTRPLSVLRRGSARLAEAEDPAAEEPITFTGRNDEFAQVVRSVNALHAHAAGLAQRIATLEADRKHLVGQRQKMADAREELRGELAEATAHMERMRHSIGGTFVNLALRTLGLVERQLGVIEGLEEREDDPDRLATLFKLDHFATVMRRHSENLLVLAGTEHGRHTAGPVPLVDVVRAAVSEIERYERVRIAALPPHAHIAGFAADDLSHLLAELMENATAFSPPDMPVEVSAWLMENGEVMLSVQDEGIGMAEERLERLNTRLSEFDPEAAYDAESEEGLGLGLYVVARLAHRHGVRVQLRKQKQGGIAAVVVLPDPLLAPATPAAVPASVPGVAHTVSLPGADAEANSNVLRGRDKSGDPLVDLAERSIEARAAAEAATPETPTAPEAEVPGAAQATAHPDTPVAAAEPTPGDAARVAAPEPQADAPATSAAAPAAARKDAAASAAPAAGTEAGPSVPHGTVPGTASAPNPGDAGVAAQQSQTGAPAQSDAPPAAEPAATSGSALADGRTDAAASAGPGQAAPFAGTEAGPSAKHGVAPGAAVEPATSETAPVAAEEPQAGARATSDAATSGSALADGRTDAAASAGPGQAVPFAGTEAGPSAKHGVAPGAAVEPATSETAPVAAEEPQAGAPATSAAAPAADTTAAPGAAPAVRRTNAAASADLGEAGPAAGTAGQNGFVAPDALAGVGVDEARSHDVPPARSSEPVAPAERPAETTMELFIPAQPEGRAPAVEGHAGSAAPADEGVRPGAGHAPASPSAPAPEASPAPGGHASERAVPAPGGHERAVPAPEGHAPEQNTPAPGAPAPEQHVPAPGGPAPDTAAPDTPAGRPEHARVADGAGDGAVDEEPVTAKGLPKRTPKITAPVAPPRPRSGSVDAEALRKRLGGFRRGADAGRRDVEAELAAERPRGDDTTEEATGGTVEEASS